MYSNEFVNIYSQIEKMKEILGRGPSELEVIFYPKEDKQILKERVKEIMREEFDKIRIEHNQFLKDQRNILHSYIDIVTEKIISHFKK